MRLSLAAEARLMDSATPVASAADLREALHEVRRERDSLMLANGHGQQLLEALDSLLTVGTEDDPFARVFAALRKIATFSQALMLSDTGEGTALQCIVGEPAALVGSRWPAGPLFHSVMAGRVVATCSHVDVEEWRDAGALGLSADQAALYVPVRVRDRRGILVLLRPRGSGGFDRQQVALAHKFSVLASHALAVRYASETEVESRHLRKLTEQLRHSEQMAKRNAHLLNEVVNVLPVGVTVQDEKGTLLVVNDAAAATFGQPAAALRGGTPFDWAGALAEAERAQHIERLRDDATHTEERTVSGGETPQTLLTTYKPVHIFDETLLLSASLDITERKRFEDELSRRAFHDQLTGLPNRALMAEIADTALRTHRRGGMFALAFIDIDNFKQVNDYYSHALGDQLLVRVAQRIRENIRPADTLARISGDEFLLLINALQRQEELPPLIDRVSEALKQPFSIEGHEILTSASIGVSIYPLHADSYEALRRCADSAMYRAKRHRMGSASYFELAMGNALTARMELEQRLRAAIRERRFKAAFQPKVRIASGEVVGFEALVRWVEPDGTVHMPGSFIELAGELGLLDEITRFMLDDVALTLPRLMRLHGPDISVSVNVAAKQAGDRPFMRSLIDQLVIAGVAQHVVVELTEEALIATQHFQREVLPDLRYLGVRVSIDDFGTGYSSLSTLADITADEVKVDRAFISSIHQRVRSQGILKAIESLCSALDIRMVAEGVETAEELAYLRQHTSIELAQGYYFSKPMFIDALEHAASKAISLSRSREPGEPAKKAGTRYY